MSKPTKENASQEQAAHERQNARKGQKTFNDTAPDKKLSGPNRPAE